LVVIIVALLIAGSIAAYAYFGGRGHSSSPTVISTLLIKGAQSDYAYGSSVSFGFNISAPFSHLSGAFATNTSLILYVMTLNEYQLRSPGSIPVLYDYTTGNVKDANVSLLLSEGQWYLLFDFMNDTGRTVHTVNGTGVLSDTHLTVNETFTIAPVSLQGESLVLPYGPTYLNLQGDRGSTVGGELAVDMSEPGYLLYTVDSETFTSAYANSSSSQTVSMVVPISVAIGTSTHYFSLIPPYWLGPQGVQGSRTLPFDFNMGPFPRVIPFELGLLIQSQAPSGLYTITMTVSWSPLEGQSTTGVATFTVSLTVE
jgi:hypothetical protein